jgi:hypothetical protein
MNADSECATEAALVRLLEIISPFSWKRCFGNTFVDPRQSALICGLLPATDLKFLKS